MQKPISFNAVVIVSFKENDYRIQFQFRIQFINKDESINLLKNANLTEKVL